MENLEDKEESNHNLNIQRYQHGNVISDFNDKRYAICCFKEGNLPTITLVMIIKYLLLIPCCNQVSSRMSGECK